MQKPARLTRRACATVQFRRVKMLFHLFLSDFFQDKTLKPQALHLTPFTFLNHNLILTYYLILITEYL